MGLHRPELVSDICCGIGASSICPSFADRQLTTETTELQVATGSTTLNPWGGQPKFVRRRVGAAIASSSGLRRFLFLAGELMAESEGFEPPIALRLCLISSQVHSTGLCQLSALALVYNNWPRRPG